MSKEWQHKATRLQRKFIFIIQREEHRAEKSLSLSSCSHMIWMVLMLNVKKGKILCVEKSTDNNIKPRKHIFRWWVKRVLVAFYFVLILISRKRKTFLSASALLWHIHIKIRWKVIRSTFEAEKLLATVLEETKEWSGSLFYMNI